MKLGVRVKSFQQKRRNDESGTRENDNDFMNSFFLSDLDIAVADPSEASLGAALEKYLSVPLDSSKRIDVLRDPDLPGFLGPVIPRATPHRTVV